MCCSLLTLGLLRFLWVLLLKKAYFPLKQGEKQLGTTDTLKMFEHLQEEANTFFKYYEKHLEQQLLSKSAPQAPSFAEGACRSARGGSEARSTPPRFCAASQNPTPGTPSHRAGAATLDTEWEMSSAKSECH